MGCFFFCNECSCEGCGYSLTVLSGCGGASGASHGPAGFPLLWPRPGRVQNSRGRSCGSTSVALKQLDPCIPGQGHNNGVLKHPMRPRTPTEPHSNANSRQVSLITLSKLKRKLQLTAVPESPALTSLKPANRQGAGGVGPAGAA